MGVLTEILVLLAGSVLTVAVAQRVSLPPILGYLLVGIIAGPHAAGFVANPEDIRFLAEFGVVFLLFTVGLELSLPQLIAMRWTVLGLGGSQVVLTAAVVGVAALALGRTPFAAIVLGGVLALSSTAIVTKQLTEQVEIHTKHGRKAVGVLLFQDLAVVPLLILVGLLSNRPSAGIAAPLLIAFLKGIAVFAALILLGRWVLRPLFREVAQARSNELFVLTALLVSLSAAWLSEQAGLSLALGAFLAGMMLGETEFRHQIEADIRPFRDVLLGLFFIAIGMLVDVHALLRLWPWVVSLAVALLVFKAALIYGLARIAGESATVATRTALVLAQGGEFGFAILALASRGHLLDPASSQIALAAILLSMAAAPLLIRYNGPLARRFTRPGDGSALQAVEEAAQGLNKHVIVCGYGRTGQNIARFLDHEDIPFLALDLDPARAREAVTAGERVRFGDISRSDILEAAGLRRARMIIITFNDAHASLRVLEHTRMRRPDIPVLVRTADDVYLDAFQSAGATAVVPETLEASLMLASHALALLEIPMSRIFRYVREVRTDRYRLLRGYFHGEEKMDLEKADRFREQLHAVTLPSGARAVGKTLAELNLEAMAVAVTAVRRGGIRGPQPEPRTVLEAGDVLVLYGNPEDLEQAEATLLSG